MENKKVNKKEIKDETKTYMLEGMSVGMNLSLAMAITMEPIEGYLMPEKIQSIISEAKNQVKYVNELAKNADEDDEDE